MMQISHIITNPTTGRVSLTKLAAATAHFQTAVAFGWITATKGFVPEMWIIYLGFAAGHNLMSKSLAGKTVASSTDDVDKATS